MASVRFNARKKKHFKHADSSIGSYRIMVVGQRRGSCSISDIFSQLDYIFMDSAFTAGADSICRDIEGCRLSQQCSMEKQFWFEHAGNDWHNEFGERRIHSVRKTRILLYLNSSSRFLVNVRVGKYSLPVSP